MKIEPKNKWLVIELFDASEKIGALYVPGNAAAPYKMAQIVAAGAECDNLKPGDVIVFDSLGLVDVRVANKTVTFVKAVNVLGVVE